MDRLLNFDNEVEGYKVHTETFDGPLDLLLHLIKKKKMDIMDIKLSEITSEYVFYLQDRSRINPSREGDFLMIASTLIYIKSRSLLPRTEVEEEDSPEQQLVHTLIEYEKIQKISRMLKELELQEIQLWRRETIVEKFESKEYEIEEVSAFQLAEVFLNIVKKREKEEFMYINTKDYSIEKKWDEILEKVEVEGYLNFSEYVETLESMQDVLVSFFTILEMIKRRVIVGIQKALFDTISLWKFNDSAEELPVQ